MSKLLENKVFISTRPAGQSAELENLLAEESATLISMPTIEIKPLPLDEFAVSQLKNLAEFNWIVFTSPNGLKYFFARLFEIQKNYGLPEHLKIAVVGKKTAAHLECYGTSASFINLGNTAEDFVVDFFHRVNLGERVLFPIGNLARTVIEDKISKKAVCTRILFYETLLPETVDNKAIQLIANDQYDMIVLTSPSSCTNLLQLLPEKTDPLKLRLVCIGQTTSAEVIRNGIEPLITAGTANSQGIYSAILNYFQKK
ncbi:MAG: uroporphyrinogen-III synthase [Prolixibacteraceae bacterium]|jgi:uroporphyrinogen-III synthase|nr:uroporphyrinogen-III synthase [Prolixibacteraceae bacterium]